MTFHVLVLAAFLAGAAAAQEGQEGKPPAEKPTPAPEAPPQAPGLETKDLDEVGAYADRLTGAGLGDELLATLLLDEMRERVVARRRPAGAAAGREGGEGDRPRMPRREPLGPFVKGLLDKGMKGEELATAIKKEQDRRREEMRARFEGRGGGEGRPGGAGAGPPGGAAPPGGEARGGRGAGAGMLERGMEQATEAVKKLRAQGLKGRPLAEAFYKEVRDRLEATGRGQRPPGDRPQRPGGGGGERPPSSGGAGSNG